MKKTTLLRLGHIVCLLFCGFAAPGATASATVQATRPEYHEGIFKGSSEDFSSIDVLMPADGRPESQSLRHLIVPNGPLQPQLQNMKLAKGDVVSVATVPRDADQQTLLEIRVQTVNLSILHEIAIFASFFAAYLALCALLAGGNPTKLAIGEDGHYSNSKFQMLLWFGVVIVSYLSFLCVRAMHSYGSIIGSVGIPENLALLSGLSVLTFGGAKGITTEKVQAAEAAGDNDPKPRTSAPRFLNDLTHNDKNQIDFGDCQMVIVTLVAVGTYLLIVLHTLSTLELRSAMSLPDVDTTILALFGLGQGAYLTKKAVGKVGES